MELAIIDAIACSASVALLWLTVTLGRRVGWDGSRVHLSVIGIALGIVAFVIRLLVFHEAGDPSTLSEYMAFLNQSPGELFGMVPFVVAGAVMGVMASRFSSNRTAPP